MQNGNSEILCKEKLRQKIKRDSNKLHVHSFLHTSIRFLQLNTIKILSEACLAIREKQGNIPSIINSKDLIILLHQHNDVWFVGVGDGDDFALYAITLLKHISQLLQSLLSKGCTERSIKDEYPTVYRVLDLAVDYGFPFFEESNVIKAILQRPPPDPRTHQSKINVDLNHTWRMTNVRHLTNEVYVDVIEKVDLVVNQHGITATQSKLPIWIIPKFNWAKGGVTFEICLKPEQNLTKPIEDILISFILPQGVVQPTLTVPIGKATFDPTTREVKWSIDRYQKKENLILKGTSSTDLNFELNEQHPIIYCNFVSTGQSAS